MRRVMGLLGLMVFLEPLVLDELLADASSVLEVLGDCRRKRLCKSADRRLAFQPVGELQVLGLRAALRVDGLFGISRDDVDKWRSDPVEQASQPKTVRINLDLPILAFFFGGE